MFNDYIWKLYLDAGGKDMARMFEGNLCKSFSKDYSTKISLLRRGYCPDRDIANDEKQQLLDLSHDLAEGVYLLENGEYTIMSALRSFFDQKDEDNLSCQKFFNLFSGSVAYYTTFLAIELPELFVPYYFTWNFNVLEKIAQEFEIELPPIPLKKDYEGRFYYYGEICEALFEFREEHGMTPYELCAFLYDFAPKCIGGVDSYIIHSLPTPGSAFFIGGSKDDIFLNDNKEISCWQCNPETRPGDMIVMYLRAPISSVDSVWRSISFGFNDPFFYYYRCTYIANPVKVEQVSKKQLQEDKIFKNLPIVRKNMQGINGVELKPSEYNHLMELAKADVPRLQFDITDGDLEFVNEKDVENKLIKPLLAKLGYSEQDYTQQLYMEIGNHNQMLITDFALSPVRTTGHQSAFAVIEAKRSILNKREMEEAQMQVRSYARQLNTKYSAIMSKERIWVSCWDDDFSKGIFESTWQGLNDADTFSKLFKLIGKR